MYQDYVWRSERREVRIGQPYRFRRVTPPWILNFPTKRHWRAVTNLADIIAGLEYLEQHYEEWGIASLAVPPLGCGLGQLEWRVVGPTLYRHLKGLNIPVELYAPLGTPHGDLQPAYLDKESATAEGSAAPMKIEPAWIAVVEILRRLEAEPYHWPVGRVSLQKIAYFATVMGIPTGLEYKRASFGPYAAGLKPQIARLMNNGLIHEQSLGRMFAVRVGSTFQDALKVYGQHLDQWKLAIDRVTDLFARMNTNQAELAATVHFAAQNLMDSTGRKASEREVLNEVMQWKKKRRPPLHEHEVAQTIRSLAVLGWLPVSASSDLPVDEELLLVE